MAELRVKWVPVGEVRPYPGNPRRNEAAVDAVAASIREFGWRQPIVVDADGTIVCGHTRYKAAQALGEERVPVTVAADLTPEQVAAYRLADNKVGELAEWDDGLLSLELDGISDIDMGLFGFDLDGLGLTDEGLGDAFELPDGERGEFEQMTFQLTHGEAECVRGALARCGCERSGEALAMVVREWLG